MIIMIQTISTRGCRPYVLPRRVIGDSSPITTLHHLYFTRFLDQEVLQNWNRIDLIHRFGKGYEDGSKTQGFLVRFSLANILQDF